MERAFTDPIRPRQAPKVDRWGEYLPFPNITCVCPLDPTNFPTLQFLPAELNRVAGDYLNPLPFDSYHSTLCSGPMKFMHKDEASWESVLRDRRWIDVAKFLDRSHYAPSGLVIGSVVVKRSGGLAMYLHPVETSKNGESSDDGAKVPYRGNTEDLQIREKLRRLSGGLFEQRDRTWHITLAYPRAASGEMPPSIRGQVLRTVRSAFQMTEESSSHVLTFHSAALCMSPDMTRFQAWDGRPPAQE